MSDALRPNIVLIGPPGAGKTSVGRRIGTLTSREFVDIGAELSVTHGDLYALPVARRTEIERAFVAELSPRRNLVVATTPETMLDQDNVVALLGAENYVLTAETSALAERITTEGIGMRPNLAEADDLEATLDELKADREKTYTQFTSLDTTGKSIEEVIDGLRAAGATIEDPAALDEATASADGLDATTRIYLYVIAAAVAILLVLLIMILTFN